MTARMGRPIAKTYELLGKHKTMKELANMVGCSISTMCKRLQKMTPAQAVALGANGNESRCACHEYQGQVLNAAALAKIAGCSQRTMQRRLQRQNSVDRAVAMGPADPRRPRPEARKPKPPKVSPRDRATKYMHDGQQVTAVDLAALAGCSADTMRARLRAGIAPALAVEMGKADIRRKRVLAQKPERKSAAVEPHRHAKRRARQQASWQAAKIAKDARRSPQGEVIVPKGLQVQRAPAPRGRFDVDNAPALFGALKPGQYLEGGSAWAQAVAGGMR